MNPFDQSAGQERPAKPSSASRTCGICRQKIRAGDNSVSGDGEAFTHQPWIASGRPFTGAR
jgi:hypothetical protein